MSIPQVANEDKFRGIPESLYEIKKTIMQAMNMSCEYIQKFKTTQIEVIFINKKQKRLTP